MNAVVIVTGGLSEILQATPLLRTLDQELPDLHLTLAGPPAARLVAGGLPGVRETIGLRALGSRRQAAAMPGAWWALRRRRLDVAVLCSDELRARLLSYTTGIPRRIGLGGGVSAILLSDQVTPVRGENRAATWLRLAPMLGARGTLHAPEYLPEPAAQQAGEERLLGTGFEDGRILVALAPAAGHRDSAWPPERFAHLANHLAVRHGAGVVLLGGPEDRDGADSALLDIDASVLDLCGQLGLGETAAVLARCDLLVAGDSPLLHLAAAVGTPSIGLFGPTDGATHGPYGPGQRVIQALPEARSGPPGRASLARIRVEDVLAGIENTL